MMYSHLSREQIEHHLEMYRKALNRRVTVEDEMLECVKGKRPMPDKEKLMDWRTKLGTP